ncbi:hypothetical protein HN358_00815 [Candidatus Uhrbacteria bacterium]|jgi:hypothetical protein|nr:hypothetical protein [Candidatus Uhrbacteria bacterium]MBT7717427.1 hypothetical protein [Candidatus Uhrbacteria bacterium]
MNMTNILRVALYSLIAALSLTTTGCFDLSNAGVDCYWDSESGAPICDVGVGTGYGSGSGSYEDTVWVMWESSKPERLTDFTMTCTFDDRENEKFSIIADVYITDSYYVDAYFPGVPSHFDAVCSGMAYFNGVEIPLFSGEVPTGDVLVVQWEDEQVDNFWARNNELDIDYN